MNRTIDDKTKEEMIKELKLEVECIQNELDNLVQELEQVERNKRAIEEVQDYLKDKMDFYPFFNIRKVD